MSDRCPHCGAMILPTEQCCPQCGKPLGDRAASAIAGENGSEEAWQPGTVPATIGQLQSFCDYNGMPLEKMRFFVGMDYQQPRAFGIYRDGDQFVVYKNKADGSRAVRYHGPDEAFAVHELYQKLLDECHRRNIWPDGKPQKLVEKEKKAKRRAILLIVAFVALFALAAFFVIRADRKAHAHDGYYRFDGAGLYYLYGDTWYYDDDYNDWVVWGDIGYPDYADYYLGASYDSGWGYTDFEQSNTWEQIQEEHRTSSGDYDSWDAGDTDWDSDW